MTKPHNMSKYKLKIHAHVPRETCIKVAYYNRSEAKRQLKILRNLNCHDSNLKLYKCDKCDYFHIGLTYGKMEREIE